MPVLSGVRFASGPLDFARLTREPTYSELEGGTSLLNFGNRKRTGNDTHIFANETTQTMADEYDGAIRAFNLRRVSFRSAIFKCLNEKLLLTPCRSLAIALRKFVE